MYRWINPWMVRWLKSRFHGRLSGRIMVVCFRGHKSGRNYEIPVSYYQEGSRVYCFTNGRWWRNFASARPVRLLIQGVYRDGVARLDEQSLEQKVEIMRRYFLAVPGDRIFYGVRLDENGMPDRADIARAAPGIVMIRTDLTIQ